MRRLLFACSVLGTVVAFAGCFGRTGIDFDDLEAFGVEPTGPEDTGLVIVEGGTDSTVVDATDAPIPEDARPDRFIDIWDVIPIPDGGPIGECATCVRDKCGSKVNECINSPACRTGLVCVMSRCLTGGGTGGFDFACINDCFKGDLKTAGLAISTFTCVISNCGAKCGGFLGGLPGLPGGAKFAPDMKLDVETLDPSTRFCFSPEAFAPWRSELQATACAEGFASCAP